MSTSVGEMLGPDGGVEDSPRGLKVDQGTELGSQPTDETTRTGEPKAFATVDDPTGGAPPGATYLPHHDVKVALLAAQAEEMRRFRRKRLKQLFDDMRQRRPDLDFPDLGNADERECDFAERWLRSLRYREPPAPRRLPPEQPDDDGGNQSFSFTYAVPSTQILDHTVTTGEGERNIVEIADTSTEDAARPESDDGLENQNETGKSFHVTFWT
jgi:hypothetical protein